MVDLLAQSLIKNHIIRAAAVEDAVQRQVVEGGSLDTVLLENGAITEPFVLGALSEAYQMPSAGRNEIEAVAPYIPRLFPLLFAETYHLVPFRLEGQDLGVLVNRPADPQLYARIRERLSLNVQPSVTTEVRLHHAMCRLYGTQLLPRFRTLLAKLDGDAALDALVSHVDGAGTQHVLSWGLSTVRQTPARRKEDVRQKGGLLSRLVAAQDRDAIVDILLEVMATTFEFVAMFVIHGEQVNGWRGIDPESSARIARVTLPVSLPSVFQTIYATSGHYLGPLPSNSVNAQLIEDLGRTAPRAAFLAPILVGGKLAAIVYADNGAKPVSSKRVASLLLVTHRAGMCLEALIRRKKSATGKMIAGAAAPVAATPEAPEAPDAAAVELALSAPIATDAEVTVLEDEEYELLPEISEIGPAPSTPFADPAAATAEHAAPEVELLPGMEGDATTTATARDPDPWESVQVDSINDSPFSGAFAVDTSPEAATADFRKGIEGVASVAPPPADDGGGELCVSVETAEEAAGTDGEYVAFADITDSPEESVGDWEDVLVETAGLERGAVVAPAAAKAPPPSVTWEHVIAEAEAAPDIMAAAASRSVEIAGTRMDETAMLLDSLDANDPEVWRRAIEKLLAVGSSADEELARRFPGRVAVDPFASDLRLPPFSRCSGITALLAARGAGAAELVLPNFESDDRLRRFFAIYYLYAVAYPPAIEMLSRRLYDAEPRNRFLAADALRVYRSEPSYRRIVQGLRDHLKVPVFEAQVATVQVLGQLREPSAVPSLIPLVVSPRQGLARAASSALTVICGQNFGADVARWAEWWQSHFNKPRESWLTDGTRHDDPVVKKIATRELQLLTGHVEQTDSGATPEPETDRRPAAPLA